MSDKGSLGTVNMVWTLELSKADYSLDSDRWRGLRCWHSLKCQWSCKSNHYLSQTEAFILHAISDSVFNIFAALKICSQVIFVQQMDECLGGLKVRILNAHIGGLYYLSWMNKWKISKLYSRCAWITKGSKLRHPSISDTNRGENNLRPHLQTSEENV